MIDLIALLQKTFDRFSRRKSRRLVEDLLIEGSDPWQLAIHFTLDGTAFVFRSVAGDDTAALRAFGELLGAASRQTFAPYPWAQPDKLEEALAGAVSQSVQQHDASYLLTCDGVPAGHCFLWKAQHNPLSREHGLQVPELGIAVTEAYQGRGLGSLLMLLMEAVARHLDADGIELTTLPDNEAGFRTYCNVGYEHIGDIPNPAHVDVTDVALGRVQATTFFVERHMVLTLKSERKAAVLDYLKQKQELFQKLAREAEAK